MKGGHRISSSERPIEKGERLEKEGLMEGEIGIGPALRLAAYGKGKEL